MFFGVCLCVQVISAVQGRETLRSSHECQRFSHQAEIWQPVLLQRVHLRRVGNALLLNLVRIIKQAKFFVSNNMHCCKVYTPASTLLQTVWINIRSPVCYNSVSVLSLKRTTDVMFGGKQVVVCGYGEVRPQSSSHTFLVHTVMQTLKPCPVSCEFAYAHEQISM